MTVARPVKMEIHEPHSSFSKRHFSVNKCLMFSLGRKLALLTGVSKIHVQALYALNEELFLLFCVKGTNSGRLVPKF
jgi:hypothetical protein